MWGARSEGAVKAARPDATPAPRVALALGMSGPVGEALLAALIAAPLYSWVHVGHRHSAGAGASKFRPWVIGSTMIVAEDAYLLLSGDTPLASSSPVRRFPPAQALLAAGIAHNGGVRRLTIIEAADATMSDADAAAIAALSFETVLTVAAGDARAEQTASGTGGKLRLWLGLAQNRTTAPQLAAAIVAALASAAPGRHHWSAEQLSAWARQRDRQAR